MTVKSITKYREAYKVGNQFEYPEFFEIFKSCRRSIWSPEEVPFAGDMKNWESSTEDEREIIGGILKGFTQLECHVRDYWSRIPLLFPKHEIAAMCGEFCASESIHAWSYNFLSENLGLDEFEAFLGDPVAQQKLSYFLDERGIKESLAIFSGAAEGVSLFSSFAVLLSLNLEGRYKGLAQIISWSALDEGLHSTAGSMLFRELCKEDPLTDTERYNIIEGFREVIRNEFAFLDQTFSNRTLSGKYTKDDYKAFTLCRANNRLANLGINGFRFTYDQQAADRISGWFYPLVKGHTSTDFFSQSKDGGSYQAKPNRNYNALNVSAMDYSL
ncbi:ribonucleotide diphosphate reductase beta subunit [Synechococcus phage S-CBWM1]|uniref:ribonucleoside-diphosphate reductase n=1 Tax=Synechococcus phage S-CBWM1 TaxID=2053653 RepID=A0A3G1L3S1_9CAUD|nr:ribonucleotide diphosphate reductase beta subunit [Synechococcus phage S-CBWM1]ATW62834.1 ribonucleotide diphosphate reductase beta subunit [Synechococcus phage S-CBWM1]